MIKRSYYERIIRDERTLTAIRQYIYNNPVNWEKGMNIGRPCAATPSDPCQRRQSPCEP